MAKCAVSVPIVSFVTMLSCEGNLFHCANSLAVQMDTFRMYYFVLYIEKREIFSLWKIAVLYF